MLRLRASAFADGGEIPVEHTADGADLSPELRFEVDVAGVKSLALIVDDADVARERVTVHWILYNLPVTMTVLHAGQLSSSLPKGVGEGKNDWGKVGWRGPAAHDGRRHHYVFHLYAVDVVLPDLQAPTRRALLQALKGHVIGAATLVGTYATRVHRAPWW